MRSRLSIIYITSFMYVLMLLWFCFICFYHHNENKNDRSLEMNEYVYRLVHNFYFNTILKCSELSNDYDITLGIVGLATSFICVINFYL